MKKVLFITYFFPPIGGVGTQRALRYVKHLPSYGWQPRVLTVMKGAEYVRDESLLARIPEGTPITRTRFLDVTFLSRPCSRVWPRLGGYVNDVLVCFPPDQYVGWLPFAYHRAKQIMAQEQIDAIYTVSFPYTAHLVGYLLKRRTGRPWLADFRDEWTQNPFRRPRLAWQRRADIWLERRVLQTADRIVVTTEPYRISIKNLLPPRMKDKVSVVTNGFDEDDFSKRSERAKNQKFRIVYVGSLYGSQDPAYFLAAVERLVEQKLVNPQRFEAQFVGRVSPSLRSNAFERLLLSRIVKHVGFVAHREAINHLLAADALLLIVSSHRGSGNIPAKTFEYIAADRPILALTPPNGAAAELVQRTHTGLVVPPEDIGAIQKALLDLYSQWNAKTIRSEPDWTVIRQYEGRALSSTFANILNRGVEQS